jgi:hypothetical protein
MKRKDTSTGLLFTAYTRGKKEGASFSSEKNPLWNNNCDHKPDNTAESVVSMFRGTIVSDKITSFYLEL